jgi:hypothetical protein
LPSINFRLSIDERLASFLSRVNDPSLVFIENFSRQQRQYIHMRASRMRLKTITQFYNGYPVVCVLKKA